MRDKSREILPLKDGSDIVKVRQLTRQLAIAAGMSLVDQTKIVTAASELARNTVDYGKGGTVSLEILEEDHRTGLRLTFEDHGPGIPDVAAALTDGFTTGNGMGIGLGGAKRLANEFSIQTSPGEGTTIQIVRWAGARH